MNGDERPVTPETPDSPFRTTGTDHVTILGSNAGDTVAFYRDRPGMPLVLRQPNLDDPSDASVLRHRQRTHPHVLRQRRPPVRPATAARRRRLRPPPLVRGGPERFGEVMAALDEDGRGCDVFDRGIFHSLARQRRFVIELATDKYETPDDRRGEVPATAQRIRGDDGAEYAENEHRRATLEELGIEATPLPTHARPTSPLRRPDVAADTGHDGLFPVGPVVGGA